MGAIVAALAAAVLAAGVAVAVSAPARTADAGEPMSAADRSTRRTAFLDALWQPVLEQYPEALRPEVRIGRVVDDRGRLAAVASCLQDAGIVAAIDRGRLVYSNRAGQTPLDVAVSYYTCAATYPTIQTVTADLDERQLGALWDYYTATLRPCLAASGIATWIPPSRGDFAAADGHHTWNPYLPLRGGRLPPDDLVPLEQRCHAVPAWLDYRTS